MINVILKQNHYANSIIYRPRVNLLRYDITIIRKIKNQHQRADINSIQKKIIKIPDYHVSKKFLNIPIENLLKNGRIRNKPNRDNPSYTLNDLRIEIPIHDDSYSISHVEKPLTEYNLQTPNNQIHRNTGNTRNTRTNS